MPIAHLWRGYGSAVFIEFGELTPRSNSDGSPGQPEGEVSLGVEWSWRIEDVNEILCGSWSEERLWDPAFARLTNERVSRLEVFGTLPEVTLTTESGLRFLSFSTTDGQPQWHLIDRRRAEEEWWTVREGRLHWGDGTEPAF